MESRYWQPTCEFPADLVRPVRLDPLGVAGPTRGQARSKRWRRSSHGWFVPTGVDTTRVEQRILEQSMRLSPRGAVTGWAALRLRGANYFDGTTAGGRLETPVPLIRSTGRYPPGGADWRRHQVARSERELVHDVWCTTTQRALFDEMRFSSLRGAVRAMEMTAAAGLISTALMWDYVSGRPAWEGVPLVREALRLSGDDSRSPKETDLKIVWVLDAGLPPPLMNQPVFDLAGNLLGYPDLFDPLAGLVGEYDGADHKSRERHRKDVAREQRYRDHGLEYFTVVGGDLLDTSLVVTRIHSTRRRAAYLPVDRRRWTLTPPPWWPRPEPLHQRLVRLGLAPALTHT